MELPGRLRQTTLGDLLGILHRARATGTLELVEERGRTHRVHLSGGCVLSVELDGAGPSLAEVLRNEQAATDEVLRRSLLRALVSRRLHGEVLVDEFRVPPAVVGAALRRQAAWRLKFLERLDDARVAFRVALRPPRWVQLSGPMGPDDFLKGRPRARDRRGSRRTPVADDRAPWRVLGVAPGSELSEIKSAYRRLARALHPDLHPEASDAERRSLEARFAEVNAAYRALVA